MCWKCHLPSLSYYFSLNFKMGIDVFFKITHKRHLSNNRNNIYDEATIQPMETTSDICVYFCWKFVGFSTTICQLPDTMVDIFCRLIDKGFVAFPTMLLEI